MLSLVGGTAPAANPVLQTLYGFGTNPKNPQAALVQASDGYFYGTTAFGGSAGENGTIFRISSDGALDGELNPFFSFNGFPSWSRGANLF